MERSGLRHPDPVILQADPALNPRAGTPVSDEARRVAGTDAACRKEVNLVGVYKTVRFAYEERLLAANREKLEAARPILRARVAKAEAVIAGATR
ncbi:hypothetical protein [Streptosporangium sp. NPDC023615]|uniref:hypothetical protein n=1 Tax=Streptosporangium sp. NPDC023615 TaxID=3154794 RepID=UPI003438F575